VDPLQQRLLKIFAGELEERVASLNRDLLALEKDPAPGARRDLLEALFRGAHSLKGAARSVGIGEIESACHWLEDILRSIREAEIVPAPETFQLLYTSVDAVDDAGKRLQRGQPLAQSPLMSLLPRLQGAAAAGPGTGQTMPAAAERAEEGSPAMTLADRPPLPAEPARPADAGAFVRVAAAKLDEMLTHSGEFLILGKRVQARLDEAARLQQAIRSLRAEWPSLARAIGGVGTGNGVNRAGAGDGTDRPPGPAPRRSLTLDRGRRLLEQLVMDADHLVAAMAEDSRRMGQAERSFDGDIRRIRMLPFSEACEGLERVVRDLAKAAGKEVRFTVEGGDIELDRAILARLNDPLLHLLRNAIDHGIEPPDARAAAGKPSVGRVSLSASLRSGKVEVVAADDGRGLALDAIEAEGRRRGLREAELRDPAGLIFRPGFSTSETVTKTSGRGIGLDAIKTAVESMRGTVEVASEAGRGTRFILTLPLTLTILRVLVVCARGQLFALDSLSVAGLLRLGRDAPKSVDGRDTILFDGAPTPVVALADILGLAGGESAAEEKKLLIVLLAAGQRRAAIVVDALVDEQEVTVKSLGRRLSRVRNIAGATVLPSGGSLLILNTAELVQSALTGAPNRLMPSLRAEDAGRSRKRLLLVDDSITTRALERDILEVVGYEVIVAGDGAEAWRILQEEGADLVVSDVDMPEMDGFALTEAIRGSLRFRDLPVVLVTARESEQDRRRGLEAGANAYLAKSTFDQTVLLDAIAQLL